MEIDEPRDLFTQENFQKFECDWSEKQETAFFRSVDGSPPPPSTPPRVREVTFIILCRPPSRLPQRIAVLLAPTVEARMILNVSIVLDAQTNRYNVKITRVNAPNGIQVSTQGFTPPSCCCELLTRIFFEGGGRIVHGGLIEPLFIPSLALTELARTRLVLPRHTRTKQFKPTLGGGDNILTRQSTRLSGAGCTQR